MQADVGFAGGEAVVEMDYRVRTEVLEAEMRKRHWVDQDIAQRVGMYAGQVWRVRTGRTKRPEMRTLELIARALEIDVEAMIERYVLPEGRLRPGRVRRGF